MVAECFKTSEPIRVSGGLSERSSLNLVILSDQTLVSFKFSSWREPLAWGVYKYPALAGMRVYLVFQVRTNFKGG